MDRYSSIVFDVPGNKIGLIIGSKGVTIRLIEKECNCKVVIVPQVIASNEGFRTIKTIDEYNYQ